MKLEALLNHQSLNDLKQLVLMLPIEWRRDVKVNKQAQTKCLVETLNDAKKLNELVNQLTELERLQLAHIVHGGWSGLDPARFMAWHDAIPLELNPTNIYQPPAPQLLWLFLYPPLATPRYYYGSISEWTLPDELGPKLKPLLKPVPAHQLEAIAGEPPDELTLTFREYNQLFVERFQCVRRDLEKAAGQELVAILQLAQQGKLQVTAKRQQLNKSSMARALEALVAPGITFDAQLWEVEDGDDGLLTLSKMQRASAWIVMLKAAEALEIHGTKCVITPKGLAMMSAPEQETLQRVWQTWLNDDTYDELDQIADLKGLDRFQGSLVPPSTRRKKMLSALGELKPKTWYRLSDLFDHIYAQGNLPWCTENAQGLSILSYHGYKEELFGRERVRLVGSWMRIFLCEIAATLGLLELCYTVPGPPLSKLWHSEMDLTPYDGVYALRLTELGESIILNKTKLDALDVSVQAQLHVQPDQSIVATGPLPGELVVLLDSFAKPTGPLTWKLDRKLLLKAHERGDSIEDFEQRLLKAIEQEQFPKTVKVFFDDAKRRATMIHAPQPAQLFRLEDKAVALELAHDKKLKELVQMLDEHTLVIAPRDVKTLKSVARKAGYAFAH